MSDMSTKYFENISIIQLLCINIFRNNLMLLLCQVHSNLEQNTGKAYNQDRQYLSAFMVAYVKQEK